MALAQERDVDRLTPIGSHVPRQDPLQGAADRGAEVIQVNLSAPRNWAPPVTHGDEETLANGALPIFVHAPYVVNPASSDPAVRRRSRACLEAESDAAARIGAVGLVVHGGHVGPGASLDEGIERWAHSLAGADLRCRILIENTAGGTSAVARTPVGTGQLIEALRQHGHDVGVVLDTCHAHAAGIDLHRVVDDLRSICGGIDLVHANDSRDPAGSGRDRHQHLGAGMVPPEDLIGIVDAAGAPVVVETPGGAQEQSADIRWLRRHLKQIRPSGLSG